MPSVCVEDGLRLPVHKMASQAFSKGGKWCSGDWGWWNGDNEKIASIGYQLERRDETNARLRLDYRRNDEPVAYTVTLIAEPCRFGGIRWFAICPATGRRAAKLYSLGGAVSYDLDLFGGMIGAFSLETIVTDELEFKVFEISARIVAGTNLYISGSPYSDFVEPGLSNGRRIAQEIKRANEQDLLEEIVS